MTDRSHKSEDTKPEDGNLATFENPPGKLRNKQNEKSLLRGLSFCGVAMDGNSVVVDVRNDKIIRIKPLHYDWKYDPQSI